MDKERRYGLSRITVMAAVGFILMAILLAMGEILDIPYVVLNAPPTPINWHELSIELLYITIIGVFVLLSIHRLDIGRMKAEEKIRESEKEWRESFNSISDMMIITDGDYNIINANRAVEDRVKKPKEEIIGRKSYKIIHGREEPYNPCPMQESMRTKKPVTGERYQPNLDIYTSIKVSPILDDGKIDTFVHIIADITDLKKAEQKLDAERRYSRGLFEASLDPLMTFDENGVITDVNEATVKATGCGRDELIGTPFSEYFTDPERAQEGVNLVFKKGAVTDHELTMKSKTGEEIIVSYNATVFH
ncbi:MAG: PAS domain-containing protein, partial [Candidatus Altiarchaeales archaeon]|nr:PAS domain-containing protein [Candidatus Altiarchaeales archaeon]